MAQRGQFARVEQYEGPADAYQEEYREERGYRNTGRGRGHYSGRGRRPEQRMVPGDDYEGDGHSFDEDIERMERDSRSLSRNKKRGKISEFFEEDSVAESRQGQKKQVRATRGHLSDSDEEEKERKRRANQAESERLMNESQRHNREAMEAHQRNKKQRKANKGKEPVQPEPIDNGEMEYMTKNEVSLIPSRTGTFNKGLEPEIELRIFKSKRNGSTFEIKAPKRGVMGISAMTQYQSQILQGEELFVRKRKGATTAGPQASKDEASVKEFRNEVDPREVHGIDFTQLYQYYTSLYSEFTMSKRGLTRFL
jgi:hypothetical protein